MLKVWGRTNSINVQKAMWTVGELKLKHECIDAGGAFGRNNEPDYLAKNPNGLVPMIEDDGFVLWESNTIVRYLAAKHGSGTLWPVDPAKRADSEKWMDWMVTVWNPAVFPAFWGLIRTPPEQRDATAIEASRVKTIAALKIFEAALAGKDYVGGPVLTIGDIPMGCAVHRWFSLPIERPKLANLEAYYARLKQRPAYVAHVAGIPLT